MKKSIIFIITLCCVCLSGCSRADTASTVYDDNYRTCYEIFVRSFYDSDGDGLGDLAGVTEKLDYVTELGFNEIWLMPVCPSPTYHKYDVTDYYDIDEEYGTLEDYKDLVEKCHQKGIFVLFDFVMNHTSSEHPWFLEAASYLRKLPEDATMEDVDVDECPYVSYYNFSDVPQSGYVPLADSPFYYEARFWEGMPDVNFDNPGVKKEFEDIAAFWLDMGVDGFRLDAVTSYYTSDNAKNTEVLQWFSSYVKGIKEDAYIVGEAWTAQNTYAAYYESGIDSLFDFAFADAEGMIASVVKGSKGADTFGRALENEEALYASYNADFINAPFYTNHDMNRSAGYYTGEDADAKRRLAGGLNLMMSGNAFVYYGEELGMRGSGKDENKRTPMEWDLVGNDIYVYYKNAIRLRNTYPALARGRTELVEELSSKEVCVLQKEVATVANIAPETADAPSVYLAINTSGEAQTVDAFGFILTDSLSADDAVTPPTFEEEHLTLPPYGMAVLTRE